jgi:GT2 family glycosyltransferase
MPLISVIIPHLNQPAGLESCLDGLRRQTLESSLFEVIVVDNGSERLPEAVVAQFPGAVLLQELCAGPGLARNRGIKAARGEILALIDADCRAHPDWLRSALDMLETSPDRTVLGGDVQIWCQNRERMTALEAYESVFGYRFKLYIREHGFCGTGNLVVRRSHFDEVGPFRGIDVAEDMDWGRRAQASSLTFVYAPDMIVFHPARQSLRELFTKWDRHIQHSVNVSGKNTVDQIRWVLRAGVILASPFLDWTKVAASDRIHGISARIKAISVLVAIRTYRAYTMIRLLLANNGVVWNRQNAVPPSEARGRINN